MARPAEDNILTINTLGTFAVSRGDTVLSEQSARSQLVWRLFKYLITKAGTPTSTETLIDVLWDEDDERENPTKTLYSLVHRLRNILNPQGAENVSYIIFNHNAYHWNMEAPCSMDAWQMEGLIKQAQDESLDVNQRIDLYNNAIELYHGDYLSESSFEEWVLPYSNYYKRLYTQAVLDLSDLYLERGDHDLIIDLTQRAIARDPYEELLHERLILSLIQTQRLSQALAHYDHISNLLYRELGIRPSENLQRLYREIYKDNQEYQTDLNIIRRMLSQGDEQQGAFYCEFDVFRLVYQLELRTMARSGMSAFLALYTITNPKYTMPDPITLKSAIDTLKKASLLSLRRGDVVSQYSKAQMIYLLPAMTIEDGEVVMGRIKQQFEKIYESQPVILTGSLLPISAEI